VAEPFVSAFDRARIVRVGPVEAHVGQAGDPAGPDTVFLHGNPDSHDLWSETVRRLPRLHCHAPDLPGFGQSTAPRNFDCSLPNLAGFVAGVLDGLGLERVHLVVHDVGGIYGLAFAAQHPERLRSLTIFNTSFFPDFKWHTIGRLWRTPVIGELVMLAAPRWFFVRGLTSDSPAMPRAYANHAFDVFDRWSTKRMVLRWYRYMTFSKRLPGWDTKLLEATRDVPKQVIWGMKDAYVPAATADRFEAPVHRLDAHGHWAMIEAPDDSAAWIDALITRADKAALTA
jgi:pimeloyl-ACP methyl ester carboxylesterase